MKKTLSIILSIMMLISTMSIANVSAFAMQKTEAPRVYVGDTFEVEYDSLKTNNYEYYAKFVPSETDFYEFVLDTGVGKISGEVEVYLFNSKDEDVASSYMDEDDRGPVTLCTQLKKGYAYYFVVVADKCGTYKTNVTVNKHVHKLQPAVFPAVYMNIPELDLTIKENGATYNACVDCQGDELVMIGDEIYFVGYAEKTGTIYAPSTMTISKTTYVYDGNEKRPKVTIKDKKGNVIPSSNYKVTYDNNKKVGKGTVTVEFNEKKYAGEMTKTFKINPKSTKISKVTPISKGFTVKWNKQAIQTTGYQVQYATNKSFTQNKKTVTVTGTSNTSKTIKNLKSKKTYYVRVRTYNKKANCYSAWSGYRTVKTK